MSAENRQIIGRRIRVIRVTNGLSQRKLAEMSGVGHNHVSLIEKGNVNVSFDTLNKLADSLGVTVCEIVQDV